MANELNKTRETLLPQTSIRGIEFFSCQYVLLIYFVAVSVVVGVESVAKNL